MDIFKQAMKGPSRAAPPIPHANINHSSPVKHWNEDPFGADVFEPMPQYAKKKKPPPRPPPPKLNTKRNNPNVPVRPTHFVRKPTVLSSLLLHRNKATAPQNVTSSQKVTNDDMLTDYNNVVDTNKMFPKCEPKIVQTGALIDLNSPPSSPTFTTRSSSDGLSVDSFGSDATTSTNHHHAMNGGNASQAESGFEDDFDLFLHSRRNFSREDTLDDLYNVDPFSPQPVQNKASLIKKPSLNRDYLISHDKSIQPPTLKGPTIIRAKPARPKPPDTTSILKTTFGNNLILPSMSVNTTAPIHKMNNGFGDMSNLKSINWDEEISPSREQSPPMPTIPPPPPPKIENDASLAWPEDTNTSSPISKKPSTSYYAEDSSEIEEPYAIALYDYYTDHPEDLLFTTSARIKLIRRENEEWLYGSLRSGVQGLFPANYVEIKVPLPNEKPSTSHLGMAAVLYDFEPSQPGDLRLSCGDTITVMYALSDEWYYGESNGMKGQFPINYVQFLV